jgi:hypothetical protein
VRLLLTRTAGLHYLRRIGVGRPKVAHSGFGKIGLDGEEMLACITEASNRGCATEHRCVTCVSRVAYHQYGTDG